MLITSKDMQQAPNTQNIMNDVFFLSSSEWQKTQETKQFDYIVIGTGFCALAFIERVLKQDENARKKPKNIKLILD